jgi:glutathione S-transferase
METPVLYTYPLAYNPFKAALALSEKSVKYTPKYTDLFNGQSLSPQYLAINPNGTVPALVDGAVKITDSSEIVEYVNSKMPGGLLGGSDADQQQAVQWADKIKRWDGNLFLAANGGGGSAKLLSRLQEFKVKYAEARAQERPDLRDVYDKKIKALKQAAAESHDAAAVAANEEVLVDILNEAEQQLGKTQYLAGGAYSIADVTFTPLLFRLGMGGKTAYYLDPRPHVSNYYNRMKQRPSFQEVFGPASSKLTLAKTILPALLKVQLATLTGRY